MSEKLPNIMLTRETLERFFSFSIFLFNTVTHSIVFFFCHTKYPQLLPVIISHDLFVHPKQQPQSNTWSNSWVIRVFCRHAITP